MRRRRPVRAHPALSGRRSGGAHARDARDLRVRRPRDLRRRADRTAAGPRCRCSHWPVLFGSLGWNFLEYGFTFEEGVWGWVIGRDLHPDGGRPAVVRVVGEGEQRPDQRALRPAGGPRRPSTEPRPSIAWDPSHRERPPDADGADDAIEPARTPRPISAGGATSRTTSTSASSRHSLRDVESDA